MDNLTHCLVGAVPGQAGLKRAAGLAMAALITGAKLPDVDAACFLASGRLPVLVARGILRLARRMARW